VVTFNAIRIEKDDGGQRAAYVEMSDDELMDGDVDIEIAHSTLNYKDGLAITGKGPVVRRFPMIPGVDFTGRVTASTYPDFRPGDLVVAGGCGLGEAHHGGLAQRARVSGEWLVPLPDSLSPQEAMTIGTAGVTAMFCVMALERFGLTPDRGPVVVTGAVGGVGSVAVALLARGGWRVTAVTGRPEQADYLMRLGAAEILDRNEFAAPGKPLQKRRFAGGVDTVGSTTLANVISQIDYDGAVAACGNARSMDLPASVAPFILRGVALLGVESVRPRLEMRREAWKRLAQELDHAALAEIRETIPFSRAMTRAKDLVDGKAQGRIVVEIG
jgi:acrylyl-CoA reductase (NADPH)